MNLLPDYLRIQFDLYFNMNTQAVLTQIKEVLTFDLFQGMYSPETEKMPSNLFSQDPLSSRILNGFMASVWYNV